MSAPTTTTMPAWRWNGLGTPLTLEHNTPVPSPGPGQALISVQACGLCHSDCNILNGPVVDAMRKIPLTLGHEVAGIVVAAGAGAEEWLHRRVAICLGGHPVVITGDVVGLECDGGYAPYVVTVASNLVALPPHVSFPQGAASSDALTTAYHAVVDAKAGGVRAGDKVAVVGLGGLGSAAVRLAVLQGAAVWGFDVVEAKFAGALESGATACFGTLEEAEGVEFDVIIDIVGKSATLNAAVAKVKYCGVVVLVGLQDPTVTVATFPVVFGNVQIRGSLGGSKDDLRAVLDLIEAGKLDPVLTEIPFEGIPEGLERLDKGQVIGRLFARPPGHQK